MQRRQLKFRLLPALIAIFLAGPLLLAGSIPAPARDYEPLPRTKPATKAKKNVTRPDGKRPPLPRAKPSQRQRSSGSAVTPKLPGAQTAIQAGLDVVWVMGDKRNQKLTFREDFEI